MTNQSDGQAKDLQFGTLAVHAGERIVPPAGMVPTATPIYATSTFLSENAEELDRVLGGTAKSYVYSRYANPTVHALEQAVNALEGGAATAVFASGMAALHAALLLAELQPGDVVLAARDLYGASHTLLNNLLGSQGVVARYVDCGSHEEFVEALHEEPRPRAVLIEPLSNPLVKVLDIAPIAEACREVGAMLIVDNTFASPFLFRPLDYGADVVVHSATKYLGGHADASGGTITIRDPEREPALRGLLKLMGAILSPFEAHLIHRGIKTLLLRMRQHSQNALAVANWLAENPAVERVHYPGLPSNGGHEIARRLFRCGYFGGMLAFELRGAGREQVYRFMDALELLIPVTTLGDVYSEVSYPVMSSHREWSLGLRRRAGISDGLLRLSVGIEEPEDIVADLRQAIEKSI